MQLGSDSKEQTEVVPSFLLKKPIKRSLECDGNVAMEVIFLFFFFTLEKRLTPASLQPPFREL